VRLAAKLLGWKIDIKSEEEKRQEVEQQMSALVSNAATPLEDVPGLGEALVEKLSAAGITTVEALADMTPEQLEAIEGIGPKTVEKISLAVNNYFSSLEGGQVVPEGEVAEVAAEGDAATEVPEEIAAEADAAVDGDAIESAPADGGEPVAETSSVEDLESAESADGNAESTEEIEPGKTPAEQGE
jgi:N utilization substance protein A